MMTREPHIPLFLWVTTALVVHALGGGGATEVAKVVEERLDIQEFAGQVRQQARYAGQPVEISFVTEPTESPSDQQPEDAPAQPAETSQEPTAEEVAPDDPPEPETEKEKEAAEKRKEREKDHPKERTEPQEKPAIQLPPIDPRRISVVQNVQDENQKDNPNARFAAEHANHVDEETQARITSTDQNDQNPTPGQQRPSQLPTPGNAEQTRVAQSEELEGQKDRGPGEGGSESRTSAPPTASSSPSGQRQAQSSPPPNPQSASEAQTASPDVHRHADGSFVVSGPQDARQARPGKQLPPTHRKYSDLLGFGSTARTKNGVNLNLDQRMARAVVGADNMDHIHRVAGEKRLSEHRGGWDNLGLERWRSAIENYVATVKPGNQTALNTAQSPFARYLNQIHQRLHGVFADGFLASLDRLPADHPLNNQEMTTHLEIALNPADGSIVKMGITKSSGVTMFDVGALESVKKASPYGVSPSSIVSSDGNVYLHWEFHRKRIYACSTYFARPFILNVEQEPAPPRVEPPPRRDYDEEADERSGSNKTPRDEQRETTSKSG